MMRLHMRIIQVAAIALLAAPAAGQTGNIVFEGTVTKLAASTLAAVKPSERTVIVKVSRVIEKPDSISLAPGDEITVQLAQPNSAKADTKRIFRTASWIYGKTLAVREVPDAAPGANLVQRVNAADVVVTGEVTQIRPGPRQAPTKVSEHNPTNWQEAVIRVSSGLKGTVETRDVVVRFPQSGDIKWRDLPVLAQGQSFTFLLHQGAASGSSKALAFGNSVQAYTIVSAQDILPADQSAMVKMAVALAK